MITKLSCIFLPGKLCDERLWSEIMAALSDIIDPIFVDLRSKRSLNEMIEAVHNSGKTEFVLIGFSMGGYVAQQYAIKFPQQIKALGLLGTCGRAFNEEERKYRINSAEQVKTIGFQGLTDTGIRRYIDTTQRDNRQLIDLVKNMAVKSGANTFLSQHEAIIDRETILDRLSLLTCPAIIIGGKNDSLTKIEDVEILAKAIPNSEFHNLDNCGHMITLEKTEVTITLLRKWLSGIN